MHKRAKNKVVRRDDSNPVNKIRNRVQNVDKISKYSQIPISHNKPMYHDLVKHELESEEAQAQSSKQKGKT
jgi:Cys-tRNA synthase (O-phospho-L-seryl-tRNA:Cys-tRNA synthase)